jgi:hypothetical protein
MRPSVILIGQLPFGTVVTRGATLTGLDQILVPAAQQSFNVTLGGGIAGAVAGFGLAYIVNARRPDFS